MTALLDRKLVTPQTLLDMNVDGLWELVNGELVEKKMGAISMEVGLAITLILRMFCDEHKLGRVLMEASYQCFKDDPKRVRRPDVSFIAKGKLPGEKLPEGHIVVTPDLAVEVISPSNTVNDIDEKVEEYSAAGVRQLWVVSPRMRYIRIYRNGGAFSELRGDAEISGEDILPGFSCKVSDFFKTL